MSEETTSMSTKPPAPEEQARIRKEASWVDLLRQEMGKVVIGQKYLVDRLILGLLANGHVLLEGVPGLVKTLLPLHIIPMCSSTFKRIQFTPDLLPADVIGTLIYSPNQGEFSTKRSDLHEFTSC